MHRSSATVGMPAGSPGPCGTGQDVRCSGATGAGQGIAVDPGSTADPVPSRPACRVRKCPARAAADHRSHFRPVTQHRRKPCIPAPRSASRPPPLKPAAAPLLDRPAPRARVSAAEANWGPGPRAGRGIRAGRPAVAVRRPVQYAAPEDAGRLRQRRCRLP